MVGNPEGREGPSPADLSGGPEGARGVEDIVSELLSGLPESSFLDRTRARVDHVVERAEGLFDDARGAVEFAVGSRIQREGETLAQAAGRAETLVNRAAVGVAAGVLVVGTALAINRFRSGPDR